MPAAIAVPLITGAASAGATIYGAHQASSASNRAGQLEDQATQRAIEEQRREYDLDQKWREMQRADLLENQGYNRGQYADYLGRLQPYSAAGQRQLTSLEAILGREGTPVAPVGGANAETVRLKAPDGSIRAVPANVADHYVSKGAVRI